VSAQEIALVVGTRPEATKVAPVHLELARTPGWEPSLVYTGQHGDYIRDALEPFDLKPDITLGLDRGTGSLVELNSRLQEALAPVLDPGRFVAVLVQGDTASTLAAALIAYWQRLPLVHLEAGLRSGNLDAPFPEEGNRRLVSPLARLHLAPTARAAANLRREGVPEADIVVVGNTSIDAVLHTAARRHLYQTPLPGGFRRHVLVTAHRRESWGTGIRAIGSAVRRLAAANPDTLFLVATHLNPEVQSDMRRGLGDIANGLLLPPQPYGEFVRLLADAHLVLTDSGGIQEEASALDVPVLVLREVTERTEGVDVGCTRLVGTTPDRIVTEAQHLLDDPVAHARMAHAGCPYGDGHSARRCVTAIDQVFGVR
jgi:UDP-N-acetylglucosamine 2-epimerase (non-hydrolysing)